MGSLSCKAIARAGRVAAWILLLGGAGVARGHEIPSSTIALDIGRSVVHMELQLPLSELAAATQLPLEAAPPSATHTFARALTRYLEEHIRAQARDGGGFALHVDSMSLRETRNPAWLGNHWLVVWLTLEAPAGDSPTFIDLHYSVIIERVISHQALLYVRRDVRNGVLGEQPVLVGTFGFGTPHVVVDGSSGSWWRGFQRLFGLGLRHIAEGPDHLLFLLVLLIPAPLATWHGRWRRNAGLRRSISRMIRVVSGFTLGHSLTLALAAAGRVAPPAAIIEVAIAVSILVSAAHAWRPLFPGREPWVAAGFGLVHGLAFAEVLRGLDFDAASLALSLAAFNIGIEAMQLGVVGVTLPILLLWSRQRSYLRFRSLAALFAAACAAGWIGERAFGLVNPLGAVIGWLAPPPTQLLWLAGAGSLVAVTLLWLAMLRRRTPPSARADASSGIGA